VVDIDDGEVFQIAAHAASLGVWDWDLTTNAIAYSKRAKQICGFAPDAPVTFEDVRGVVHPEDLPRTSAMARNARDAAGPAVEPYRYRVIRADTGETRWVLAHGEVLFESRQGDSQAVRYVGTIQDITEQHDAEASLADSEERLRFAIEAGKMAVWEIDLDLDRITPSRELNLLCGFPADAEPTLDDFRSRYAPGEEERIERESAAVRARGETQIQTTFKQLWPDGTEKWLLLRAQLAPPSKTITRRVIGVLIDITAQKRAEQQAETIAAEMQHRVKNTIAVVLALAEQSLRGRTDIAEARRALAGRLRALGTANGTLTQAGWSGGDVRTIVDEIIAPYRERDIDPFSIDGPALQLTAKHATALALALHELSTNAIKYGALSVGEGRVSIAWTVEAATLRLFWRESGGPSVQPQPAPGFGTRLLQRGLLAQGAVVMEFLPAGVACTIAMQLKEEP
jgi:PAS domain S-box-containing protein